VDLLVLVLEVVAAELVDLVDMESLHHLVLELGKPVL
jgi:hypothetical protein